LIQDIGDHRFDNSYRDLPARPSDVVLRYRDREVLVRDAGGAAGAAGAGAGGAAAPDATEAAGADAVGPELGLPLVSDLPAGADPAGLTFLFTIDDTRFFLSEDEGAPVPAGLRYEGVARLRTDRPRWLAFACVTGYQLRNWYRDNRFCGRCGHPMLRVRRNRELCCPECANVVYPKIQPAVICGVTHGSKILLTKYAGRKYAHFALVAGFNEVGESLEETCRREVMEEVGIRVRRLRYYKDQPWPFTDTLLAGFFCELDGTSRITLDTSELRLGVWTDRSEIPERLPDTSSLTNEMILYFRNHPEAF
jgi:NAD+ diphosphatase